MKKKLVIAALMTLLLALAVSGAMADSCDHNNWSAWTVKDNTTHSRSCQTEGCYATEYENHYGGKATCVSKPSCEVCGRAYGKSTGVHEWVVTATTDTQHTLTCPGCQRTQTADHSGGTANCSEKAKCETCGQAYGTTNDQHAWNYNNAVVVREATCQYGKVTQYSCYHCGTTTSSMDTQTLDCIGEPRVGKEPTCTEEGYYVMVCKMCGEEKGRGDNIPCVPHSLIQKQALAPTCTEDGYYVKVCTLCGQEVGRGDTIPKLGHDLVKTVTQEPSCSVQEQGRYDCTRCGESRPYDTLTFDTTKHTALGEEKTERATCCWTGRVYRVCADCKAEVTVSVIPSTGHAYFYTEYDGSANAATHNLHCNYGCCAYEEGSPYKREAHYGGKATCTTGALCEVCGYEYTEPLGHTMGKWYYKTADHDMRECSKCDYYEIERHSYGPASYMDETTHSAKCARCGMTRISEHSTASITCYRQQECDECGKAYGPWVAHRYVLVETIPGTCEEPGKLVYECSVCQKRSEYDHYTEESLSYQTLDSKEDWADALMYHKVRCDAHGTDWRTEYHFGGTPDANGVLTCAGCGAKYYLGTNNAKPAYHYLSTSTNLVVKNPTSDAEIGTTTGSFVYVNDALCFVIAADGNLMSGYSNEILGTIRNDMLYDNKGNMIGLLLGNELILGSPDADYDWSAAMERYYTLHPELAPAE